MTTLSKRQGWLESTRLILVLVSREIQDVLRDWRLVAPILVLTLGFPFLGNLTADEIIHFLNQYGDNTIIFERLIPFLLMIIGFFPISFSLVIALETFVGEKERRSLEPLLASPLSDLQLYLGKIIASMIVPLVASYLGIFLYLIALYVVQGWVPPPLVLFQILALTTGEGLVMVSGAVIISSQTTSVRAANLLASFIIIPVALLVQGESVIMFWARYDALWGILAFLLVGNLLLLRMGYRLFSREELLGREIDMLNLGRTWDTFYRHLRWKSWSFGREPDELPPPLRWLGFLIGLYRYEIPAILRRSRAALIVALTAMAGSFLVGWWFAVRHPLPEALFMGLTGGGIPEELLAAEIPNILPARVILFHNIRALAASAMLGVFSFGALTAAILMLTPTIAVYLGFQVSSAGQNGLLFLLALVAPHGILEFSAAILSTALGIRLGAVFVAPPQGMSAGEAWLQALADFIKGFVAVVIPMLTVAALIESYITPQIALWIYGG